MRVARAVALVGLGLCWGGLLGCGATPKTPKAPPETLHLAHACDLAPAARLDWVVDADPKRIASIEDLMPAIGLLLPEERLAAFAEGHGGLDLRRIDELCVARYDDGTVLSIARAPFDPNRVERAFADRSSRLVARSRVVEDPPVIAVEADAQGTRERLGLFAREVAALEHGPGDPLRASFAFARGRLKRAAPALRTPTVARAEKELGDAPLRFFARGPFAHESSTGALWRSSDVVAVSASFAGAPAKLAVRAVLVGPWEGREAEAREAALATVRAVQESAVGKIVGFDRLLSGPDVRVTADAIVLDVTVDAMQLARGLRDATSAGIGDVLAR